MEDLKRAKNLKKQEIFDKLKQIQEITGNKTVGFNEIDLETDFNPEDYDQKMESMFSDQYYDGDENEKPVFDDDIDLGDIEGLSDDAASGAEDDSEAEDQEEEEVAEEEEAYAPIPEEEEGYEGYDQEGYYDEYGYGEGEDEDILMDADYLPGGENFGKAPPNKKETKKERAQREKEEKKLAKRARSDGIKTASGALQAARTMLDADKKKDFNTYLDDYYQLDYEDMVMSHPSRLFLPP